MSLTEDEVLQLIMDLQAGAKGRICSDDRIEDTVEHEAWQKSEEIYGAVATAKL